MRGKTRSTRTTRWRPTQPIRARQLASGAGVASEFKTITPPALLLFEPHQPELCGFVPTTFLDITPVWEQKLAAMEAMGAQEYLRQYYTERAGHRANHARRISGRTDIRYAEAFQREIPAGGRRPVTAASRRSPGSGVATRARGAGKDRPRRSPACCRSCRARGPRDERGRRSAAPATTSWCTPPSRTPGRATCSYSQRPSRAPVALVGDLLATQALDQGVAGAARRRRRPRPRRAARSSGCRSGRGSCGRRERPRSTWVSSTCPWWSAEPRSIQAT